MMKSKGGEHLQLLLQESLSAPTEKEGGGRGANEKNPIWAQKGEKKNPSTPAGEATKVKNGTRQKLQIQRTVDQDKR